ncbi:hypothetical protein CLU79DRAFT_723383 [Phycomyces nitens]|nr:hypothetical protein CLU79DRAFT_723383 [Phycomyces nitens]
MNLFLLFICLATYSAVTVNASYFLPQKVLGEVEHRYSSATFVRNNTVYAYGGNTYMDAKSNVMSAISFSSLGNVIYKELPTNPTDPHCVYPSTIMLPKNDTALLLCGEWSQELMTTILSIWSYSFSTPNPIWTQVTIIPDKEILTVEGRFNAVLGSDGKVYIYFTFVETTANMTNEFVSYDPETRRVTDLSKTIPLHLLYTSTVALPNWKIQPVSGHKFLPRNFPNSALGISPHINGVDAMYNDLLLLNTTTWNWTLLEASGYAPSPRLYASMGFIHDDILMISFGILTPTPRNDMNFLRYITDGSKPSFWMRDYQEYQDGQTPVVAVKKGLKAGSIAGIPVFSEYIGEITCFLYAAPSTFVLTDPARGVGNGTSLIFSFYGDPTVAGAIHTVFFPPAMDPNIILYNINTTGIDPIITPEQMDDWVVADLDDRYAQNVYTVNPNTTTTLGYDLQEYQYLRDSGWNNIGFAPEMDKTPQISTVFRSGTISKNTRALSYIISTLKVFPNEYVDVILQEKKTSTLLDALGSAGGVLSLIMGVQLWLFGFRPQSPWGVVHRWSIGRMSHSIKENLRSGFEPMHKAIPFVDPVGQTVLPPTMIQPETEGKDTARLLAGPTEGSDQTQRLLHVEERIQLMEQMLKAYYINTEIFNEFSHSIKTGQPNIPGSDVIETIPTTESGGMRQRLWGRDNV